MTSQIKNLLRLLVIADDFTGALDTGIQFARAGVKTQVVLSCDRSTLDNSSAAVFVYDSETRHLSAEEAYARVYTAAANAGECGFNCFYKKTDSALRGNVGSELAALVDATGKRLLFIPAFPQMNRTTVNGVQMIDGVPVADSVFGKDPFEPVLESKVSAIIAAEADIETSCFPPDAYPPDNMSRGIDIFDAQTTTDIERIIKSCSKERLHICAGCAGFASVLSQALPFERSAPEPASLPGKILVVNGSLNPISRKQTEWAFTKGLPRILFDVGSGRLAVSDGETPECLLDSKGVLILETDLSYALSPAGSPPDIARRLAGVVSEILLKEDDCALFVIGGDTLMAVSEILNVTELTPLRELFPGIVLSRIVCSQGTRYLISKSGGFGAEDLIGRIINLKSSEREGMTYHE